MDGFAMTVEVMLSSEPMAASTTSELLWCLLVVRCNVRLEVMLARRA
jgi:hypothetical protein